MVAEKRKHKRKYLDYYCDTKFQHKGQEGNALMINLSPVGAGFLIHQRQPMGLAVGDKLELTIDTPHGEAKCVGEVRWINSVTSGICFGVSFEGSLPDDDPLIQLANEP